MGNQNNYQDDTKSGQVQQPGQRGVDPSIQKDATKRAPQEQPFSKDQTRANQPGRSQTADEDLADRNQDI